MEREVRDEPLRRERQRHALTVAREVEAVEQAHDETRAAGRPLGTAGRRTRTRGGSTIRRPRGHGAAFPPSRRGRIMTSPRSVVKS